MQNGLGERFWDAHGVEIEARQKMAPKSRVVKRPWLAEILVSHDGLPRPRKSLTTVGPNQGLVTSDFIGREFSKYRGGWCGRVRATHQSNGLDTEAAFLWEFGFGSALER